MRYSLQEKKDLIYACLGISLAFAILFAGGYRALFALTEAQSIMRFAIIFGISFGTAGIAFILHELMHKRAANKYALYAEFKAFPAMIWLAILFSLFGFIFAAPGAVFIRGNMNKERNGRISLAGPVTNMILAGIFAIILLAITFSSITFSAGWTYLLYFIEYGLSINALIALFNLIPVMPFDGAKVLDWNKGVYALTVIIALGLFVVSLFV